MGRLNTILATAALSAVLCASPSTSVGELPNEIRRAMMRGDFPSAVSWMTTAAKAGDAHAALELGKLYRLGHGVNKDLDRAEALFVQASAQGLPAATALLTKFRNRKPGVTHPRVSEQGAREDTEDLFDQVRSGTAPKTNLSIAVANSVDAAGTPLLVYAVRIGAEHWIDALLGAGASVDARDRNGNSALHSAVAKEDVVSVAKLVEAGADSRLKNSAGWSPHMLAERRSSQRLLHAMGVRSTRRFTAAGTSVNKSELLQAVRLGKHGKVTRLLAQSGWANTVDSAGMPLLGVAVKSGHPSVVMALIRAGADVNKTFAAGLTPVHLAIQHQDLTSLSHLSNAAADLNRLSDGGLTPMALAIRRGCEPCVQHLIEHGATLSSNTPKNGLTYLIQAAKRGQQDAVMALLRAGAKAAATDNDGRTALWWALKQGHLIVAELLIRQPGRAIADHNGVGPLHLAVQQDAAQIIDVLANPESLAARTLQGNTALMMAAHENSVGAVKALIRLGAVVDAVNKTGDSALIIAVRQDALTSADALVAAGASLNLRNLRDQSAATLIESGQDPRWLSLQDNAPGVLQSFVRNFTQD